jgi:glycerol kinase
VSKLVAILAIDQGTTGSTSLVIAQDGRVLGRAYSEFTQYFPRPGWVEHDANEIWDVTQSVAQDALTSAGEADIQGIGITNQRETVVLWDRETLDPVSRAIVWQDRRTLDLCAELKDAGHEEEIRNRTGLVLDRYFSGTKLMWLLRERPELLARAEAGELAAGTIDTWLIARMTQGNVHATDPTNASRTLLYNLSKASWDPWLLDLLGVPPSLLPEVRSSSGDFGVVSGEVFGIEAPIAGVAGDQQAALFGQGCWSAGLAKNTYGTGAFLLMHTGSDIVMSSHGLLTTAACDANGGLAFALEGSVFIAGAAIQWLRDGLGVLEHATESERMAYSLESNDGVYFVPAFVGLGAPHWVPQARGSIFGITRGTSREHLVRAALEAMAYGTREMIEAMEADSSVSMTKLHVDGGAANNDWLMTFQADILGVPVRRPDMVEITALGVAGLAGLATGVWSDASQFLDSQGEEQQFDSVMQSSERKSLLDGWDQAVRAVKIWSHDSGSA